MTSEHRVFGSIADRAIAIAQHLPPDPFTKGCLLDHATGLNAVDNAADIDAILAYLVDTGAIVKLGPNIAMWVRVDRAGEVARDEPSPHLIDRRQP